MKAEQKTNPNRIRTLFLVSIANFKDYYCTVEFEWVIDVVDEKIRVRFRTEAFTAPVFKMLRHSSMIRNLSVFWFVLNRSHHSLNLPSKLTSDTTQRKSVCVWQIPIE